MEQYFIYFSWTSTDLVQLTLTFSGPTSWTSACLGHLDWTTTYRTSTTSQWGFFFFLGPALDRPLPSGQNLDQLSFSSLQVSLELQSRSAQLIGQNLTPDYLVQVLSGQELSYLQAPFYFRFADNFCWCSGPLRSAIQLRQTVRLQMLRFLFNQFRCYSGSSKLFSCYFQFSC